MSQPDFQELYERYVGPVYLTVYRLCKDPLVTEDLVQEAFVRVYLKMDQLEDRDKFFPYLKKTARNLALNHLQRRRDHKRLDDLPFLCESERDLSFEDKEALQRGLENLPEKYQRVLTLYYLEERERKEVAAQLKVSHTTVANWLERGLEMLRLALKEPGIEEVAI